MRTHAENIELYLSSGGDPRLAKLHKTSTLQNRSRIVYLLSKLQKIEPKATFEEKKVIPEKEISIKLDPETPKFIGKIMQFPVELHSTYNETIDIWFKYCSLKLDLNKVERAEEKKALEIQNKIIDLFKRFDTCKKILDHYLIHKHILPTESKNDFKDLTPLQLDQERRNLESSISRRKQTIRRMEESLPEESDPVFNRRVSSLNRKKEQLQEFILDHEKIKQLLHN
ncbi:hypothetical protein ACNFU2_06510 [Chryseobacterium sp. PTM-20240506]|uniref:hypothetical protein n=1 Tax=Chryseobacterium sp. PTM-20240506 TaxID=3400631 RepID=UPI003AB00E58